MTASVWWVRRDLRLHDNPALHAARSAGGPVYAAFCLDELPANNPRQRAFVIACLRKLRIDIEKHGATLSVVTGSPEKSLSALCSRLDARTVFVSRAYAPNEAALDAAAEASLSAGGVQLVRTHSDLIHEIEAIAAQKQSPGEAYRVFPPFYEAWSKLDVDRPLPEIAPDGRDEFPGALPDTPDVNDPMPGEAAARDQLQRFVAARAASYAFMGAFPATDGTSKLAPYFRFGVMSPRTAYQQVAERMARTSTLEQERVSMRGFLRRFAQRDFFMQLAHVAPRVHDEPLQDKMRGFEWSHDAERVEAWTEGRTGYPLIDAAMRQLALRGYVHQRAAVCAASFCCFDLGLDWRIGRDVWMRRLIAADEPLCDGNWQWLAGVGSDQAAYPRIYNPIKQARLIDPQGVYVRRWVRELAKLPTRAALTPWELTRQQQTELGFFTPELYPPPMVNHHEAAGAMLARYQAFRNRADL